MSLFRGFFPAVDLKAFRPSFFLEAIAIRLEAIATWLEAIAGLEASY